MLARVHPPVELLYDVDCGICTRSVGVLRRIDRRRRVTALPLQSEVARQRFGLTEELARQQVWTLDARGRRRGGAEAVNVALSAALGSSAPLWLYRLPGVRWLQDRVYRAVVANRHRLPGRAEACATGG